MQSLIKICGTFLLMLLMLNCSKSNDVDLSHLIAHYQLATDAVDLTGKNTQIKLQNAPFEQGGVYCNGIYSYSGTNPCRVETPPIADLNPEALMVSIDFNATEIKAQPVWVLGTGCRWLGFYLMDDGKIALLYNNANWLKTNMSYSLNKWHNAKISYDGTTVNIYLDDALAGTLKFGDGYVSLDYASCSYNDFEISLTNYANGQVFKGWVKELKVFGPK